MEIGDSSSFLRRTCVGECVDWRPRPKSGPIVAPDFRFVSPASAPTFTPSKEEFEDPILYISTIRPYAEQFGMCKIIPPEDEEFPFVLNKEKFRFQTRIQNLANIDAFAKDKLIFLGRVGKFWEMRGFPLKTPIVEYRQLDLYTLHSLILRDGGYMKVVEEDNWTSVALRMKYSDSLKSGELLEKSYREILLPYLNLMSEAEKGNFAVTVEENSANKQLSAKEETTTLYKSKKIKLSPVEPRASTSRDVGVNDKAEIEELEKMYSNTIPEQEESTSKLKAELLKGPQNNFKKHIPKTFPTKATASGSKPTEPGSDSKPTEPESDSKPSENASGSKPTEPESDSKPSENASGSKTPEHVFKVPYPVSDTRHKKSNELKRLQFHGAGPRIAIFSEPASGKSGKRKRESSHKKECCKCRNSNIDEITLQCAECRDSYHLTCIVPELTEIPRVNWHCSKCILKKLEKYPSKTSKPPFEDGKEYDLHSFERKAGNFKRAFFKGDTNVSPERVEVEFWNILRKDDPVTVEYGADISGENGTGFPTLETLKSIPPRHHEELMRIVKHPWNLNNLPVSNGSVFKYIDEAISGMKVPWMYIGMLFTTFCWHNEDHWSYSINYHHFGETKTWYSVPGDYAQEFENVVKEMAPGLFEVHPDILHQLSTMINPNVLMHKKVPVYRLDQDARNIVITFPRAYHCGFNHGFNVAEAVNFAPPDWIEVGRRCVENYALSKRMCVFSQDELVFKIAARHQAADIRICAAAYHDLYRAVHDEFAFREFFMGEWGADNIECVVDFETLPDDQRQCEFCKTTVFMSGVSCGCDPVKIVCSKHYDKLCNSCKPEDHYLKIKHTSEEIFRLFKEMLKRVSPYEIWVKNVRTVLRSNSPQQERPGGFTGVEYLRNLVKVAEENRYPNTKLLKELIACVVEVEIMNETSERILSRIGRVEGGSRLVIFGKQLSVLDTEAWMYLTHYFEHIIDHRYYLLGPITVFRKCICLKDDEDDSRLKICTTYPAKTLINYFSESQTSWSGVAEPRSLTEESPKPPAMQICTTPSAERLENDASESQVPCSKVSSAEPQPLTKENPKLQPMQICTIPSSNAEPQSLIKESPNGQPKPLPTKESKTSSAKRPKNNVPENKLLYYRLINAEPPSLTKERPNDQQKIQPPSADRLEINVSESQVPCSKVSSAEPQPLTKENPKLQPMQICTIPSSNAEPQSLIKESPNGQPKPLPTKESKTLSAKRPKNNISENKVLCYRIINFDPLSSTKVSPYPQAMQICTIPSVERLENVSSQSQALCSKVSNAELPSSVKQSPNDETETSITLPVLSAWKIRFIETPSTKCLENKVSESQLHCSEVAKAPSSIEGSPNGQLKPQSAEKFIFPKSKRRKKNVSSNSSIKGSTNGQPKFQPSKKCVIPSAKRPKNNVSENQPLYYRAITAPPSASKEIPKHQPPPLICPKPIPKFLQIDVSEDQPLCYKNLKSALPSYSTTKSPNLPPTPQLSNISTTPSANCLKKNCSVDQPLLYRVWGAGPSSTTGSPNHQLSSQSSNIYSTPNAKPLKYNLSLNHTFCYRIVSTESSKVESRPVIPRKVESLSINSANSQLALKSPNKTRVFRPIKPKSPLQIPPIWRAKSKSPESSPTNGFEPGKNQLINRVESPESPFLGMESSPPESHLTLLLKVLKPHLKMKD